jgi:hypothetical protein
MEDLDRVHRADARGFLGVPAAGLRVAHGQVGARVGDLGKQVGADLHRDVAFLLLQPPYAPATPQQVASFSITWSSGTSAMRSSAGLPMPCPCCWQGALVGDGRRERTEACAQLAAIVEHHDRAQPLPHVMQVIELRERRRPRLASAGRRPAGSM